MADDAFKTPVGQLWPSMNVVQLPTNELRHSSKLFRNWSRDCGKILEQACRCKIKRCDALLADLALNIERHVLAVKNHEAAVVRHRGALGLIILVPHCRLGIAPLAAGNTVV